MKWGQQPHLPREEAKELKISSLTRLKEVIISYNDRDQTNI